MGKAQPLKKGATYDDLRAVPENFVAEMFDGELYATPRPAIPHAHAASVLGFILAWNEFLFALVLTGPDTATIPVQLASLQSQNGVQIAEVSAGVVLGVMPLLIASRFIQRYLVRGLTFGAIK